MKNLDEENRNIWLTPRQIRSKIGISDSTLRRWANENKVKFIYTYLRPQIVPLWFNYWNI